MIRNDQRKHEEIACEYGISRPHVSKLKSAKRWQHLGA